MRNAVLNVFAATIVGVLVGGVAHFALHDLGADDAWRLAGTLFASALAASIANHMSNALLYAGERR